MSDKTLGQRITTALKDRGLTKTGLAKACGVSTSSVTQWCDDSTKNLTSSNLFNAARFLKVDAEWLGTGVGNMSMRSEYVGIDSLQRIPFLNESEIDAFLADNIKPSKTILTQESVGKTAFAVQITDVKSKHVNEEQIFIVDPSYTLEDGAYVALIRGQGVFMVRDVLKDGPDVFFSGGVKNWPVSDVELIGGLTSIAESSIRSIK